MACVRYAMYEKQRDTNVTKQNDTQSKDGHHTNKYHSYV